MKQHVEVTNTSIHSFTLGKCRRTTPPSEPTLSTRILIEYQIEQTTFWSNIRKKNSFKHILSFEKPVCSKAMTWSVIAFSNSGQE